MATCDPQTLANASVCIDKCIPDGMKLAVMIYLLCQIQAQGGTGTGGANFLSGVGSPQGVANSTVVGQTYFDTAGIALWQSTALGTNNWVQMI